MDVKVEASVEAIPEEEIVHSADISVEVTSGSAVKMELCNGGNNVADESIDCPSVISNSDIIHENSEDAKVKSEIGDSANSVQSSEIAADVSVLKMETTVAAPAERYDICPFGRVGLDYAPFPITGYPVGFEDVVVDDADSPFAGPRLESLDWRVTPLKHQDWTPDIEKRFQKLSKNMKQLPELMNYCPACTTFTSDRKLSRHLKSAPHINAELAMLRSLKPDAVGTSSGGPPGGLADLEEPSPLSAFYVPPIVTVPTTFAPTVTKSKKQQRRDIENQRKEATELAGAYGQMLFAAPAGSVTTFPRFRDLEPPDVDFEALPLKPGGGKNFAGILRSKKKCLQKLVYKLSFELMRGGAAIFPPELVVKPSEATTAVETLNSWQPLAYPEDGSAPDPRARSKNNRKLRRAAFDIQRARIIRDYFRLLEHHKNGAIPSPTSGLLQLRLVDVSRKQGNGACPPHKKKKHAKKSNKRKNNNVEHNSAKKENRRKPKQRKVKQELQDDDGGSGLPGPSGGKKVKSFQPRITNKQRRRMRKETAIAAAAAATAAPQ